MEPATATPAPDTTEPPAGARGWLERRDPGLRATKRSVRAAVVVPAVFAVTDFGFSNPQTPLFAVFGSVSILLLADFGGPLRLRTRAYLGLWVVGCAAVTIGTLCSTVPVAAVVAMALVGFAVLFAGVVSPAAAAGSTAALLTFVLPVAEPAGASAVGDRLLGWVIAGAVCIPAALFVWTGRWHDRLRGVMAEAGTAVADLVERSATGADPHDDRIRVEDALRALREQYQATPYRPTGAGPTDVALTNLVSRLEWVASCALAATAEPPPSDQATEVAAVEEASAHVLHGVAELLSGQDPRSHPRAMAALATSVDRLVAARDAATEAALASLAAHRGTVDSGGADGGIEAGAALGAVDPTYPVRVLAFALEMLADIALAAAGGGDPDVGRLDRWAATALSFVRVAAGHLTLGSVWFRNSVRGAVALSLAVLVTEVTTVQHGFWVVLGTLSVLRSNALGTGSTALRAVVGSAIGFGVGAVILAAIGVRGDGLWAILPLAVLIAGITPTIVSFTVGQAGFTVLVVLIFNIIDPVGSHAGLIRVEDVVIGAAVSVGVGLLFWPRGASAELAHTLGQAYSTATAWLVAVVDRIGGASRDDDPRAPTPEGTAAMDAARRLDDAYRQYLGERGAKHLPLPVITGLLTGCARIRLTAVTLEGLPDLGVDGGPDLQHEVEVARGAVSGECTDVGDWFDRFATSLGGRHAGAHPALAIGGTITPELAAAWTAVRRTGSRDGVFAVLRLLWVEERLDDLHRLQSDLGESTDELTGPGRR